MAKFKLFLSKRVVLEDSQLDGAVLVDENGRINSILDRAKANQLVSSVNDYSIEVIDGGNLALLAGVVDSHVHINEPGRTHWEGFPTATAAAAAGGITTVVDMPLNSIPPTTTMANLKEKATAAKGNVYVDVGFWGGVIPGNQDSLQDLVKAGVVGFKCFLCPSGVEEFPNVEKRDLIKAFTALEGTGSLLAFHAELEDENTVSTCSTKDPEEYSTYLESRPPEMELNAVSFINSLLPTTKVRVHIVHVSSAEVIPLLESARRKRLEAGNTDWCAGITAETCHHYLTLNAEDVPPGRSEYKSAPPIRDQNNREKLWQYVRNEKINLVVSDHSPCTPEMKCTNNLEAWGGVSSVQFGLSLFWTGACARGIGLCEMSKYLSRGPAKLCTPLSNRKGSLKPGFDADLVFFDPEATFEVRPEIIRHKNKLTPYIGRVLRGKVEKTYLRGQLIYSNNELYGQPKGKLLLNYF